MPPDGVDGQAAEGPLTKLAYAVVLAARQKGAQQVRIRPDTALAGVVEFVIDGAVHEEMRPPAKLLPLIIRRFSVMASLPIYPRGGAAHGHIHVVIDERAEAFLAIVVRGHGAAMSALMTVISEDEFTAATRRRSARPTGVYR
jgi:type II secretory ATPase GspE/PulE/Tfp pilus assembly ATPase PilB-like protein